MAANSETVWRGLIRLGGGFGENSHIATHNGHVDVERVRSTMLEKTLGSCKTTYAVVTDFASKLATLSPQLAQTASLPGTFR